MTEAGPRRAGVPRGVRRLALPAPVRRGRRRPPHRRRGRLHALLGRRTEPPGEGPLGAPRRLRRDRRVARRGRGAGPARQGGLADVFIEQLYTFGAPGRDPRTRVIRVAYYALVEPERLRRAVAAFPDDRVRVARLDVAGDGETAAPATRRPTARPCRSPSTTPRSSATAVRRIRGKLDYAPIGFELLPDAFSLRDLRLRPRGDPRPAAQQGQLPAPDPRPRPRRSRPAAARPGVGHRPPELYRFAAREAPDDDRPRGCPGSSPSRSSPASRRSRSRSASTSSAGRSGS